MQLRMRNAPMRGNALGKTALSLRSSTSPGKDPMKIPTNHMRQPSYTTRKPTVNHTLWKINERTAIIAFESSPCLDPETPPRINRFYREEFCYSPMDAGQVVGHATGPTSALIVKVGANNLVAISEKFRRIDQLGWRYYHIGPEFEVVPLESVNRRFSRKEINAILATWPISKPESLLFGETDLPALFAGGHPPWLEQIADAQLLHWRLHEPQRFFQHTRLPLDAASLQTCVELAPFWALARWQNHLNPKQIEDCVRKCQKAAVMYATDRIPPHKRHAYLSKHPEAALDHAAERLTDEELGMCAFEETRAGLRCRGGLSARRQAIVLANAYSEIAIMGLEEPLPDFRNEVKNSIRRFPTEWLSAHPEGFPAIIDGIAFHLDIHLNATELLELFNRIAPSGREPFAEYLASKI